MRAFVIVLVGSVGWAAATAAQEPRPRQSDRPRTSLFYEATVAKDIGPHVPSTGGGLYTSWELGFLAPCRINCWGGSMFIGGNDINGPIFYAPNTVGLRVRYRRKLGSNTSLDLGLGPAWHKSQLVLGGLAAVNHGNWLGVTFQIEALRRDPTGTGAEQRDWNGYLGLRTGGKAAILMSLLEVVVVGAVVGWYVAGS